MSIEYFTEIGYSEQEVLSRIQAKYGKDIKILNKREVKLGGFLGMFSKSGVELSGYYQIVDKVIESEKKRILESAQNKKKEESSNLIISELKSLKEEIKVLKDKNIPSVNKSLSSDNEVFFKLEKILIENEFEINIIQNIIDAIKKEFTLDELEDYEKLQYYALNYIKEKILVYSQEKNSFKKPSIFVIVGPTGVGKTTTIAKLAANLKIEKSKDNKKNNVKIITLDNFRIGAKEQIEIYGNIMDVPVIFIENEEEYVEQITKIAKSTDYIFVDSIGRSPFDWSSIEYLKKIVDISSNYGLVETHLAINSSTKTSDIINIIKQFDLFNYKSIILTKVDETINIGDIISILINYKKPVSYITTGQRVPTDIKKASKNYFLSRINGFEIDMENIENES